MALRYRVDIEDQDGAVVAQFDRFISLSLSLKWNGCGSHQFFTSGFDERVAMIGDDYHVRVWLRDDEHAIDWTEIYTGFHKTWVRSLASTGGRSFASYGPALEELLKKEYILWYSGSTGAEKSGTTSAVMWEYAYENAGAGALEADGRDTDGVVTGLTFAPQQAVGPAWSGGRSRQNLLDVLIELADHSLIHNDPVDFRVIHNGGYAWLFEAGKLSVDRTTRDLNSETGENGAGNVPVVFAEILGNVASYQRSKARYSEANTIVALGQGEGVDRLVAVVQDPASVAISPVARRVAIVSTDETDLTALENAAQARLQETKATDTYTFQPYKSSPILFRDFQIGDFVTAREDDDEFHMRVAGAQITVNEQGEQVTLEFQQIALEEGTVISSETIT